MHQCMFRTLVLARIMVYSVKPLFELKHIRTAVHDPDVLSQIPSRNLDAVVNWVYPEWWAGRSTPEEVTTIYRSLLNDQQLPVALIALWNGTPAGTVLICDREPDIRLDVGPWLE